MPSTFLDTDTYVCKRNPAGRWKRAILTRIQNVSVDNSSFSIHKVSGNFWKLRKIAKHHLQVWRNHISVRNICFIGIWENRATWRRCWGMVHICEVIWPSCRTTQKASRSRSTNSQLVNWESLTAGWRACCRLSLNSARTCCTSEGGKDSSLHTWMRSPTLPEEISHRSANNWKLDV